MQSQLHDRLTSKTASDLFLPFRSVHQLVKEQVIKSARSRDLSTAV